VMSRDIWMYRFGKKSSLLHGSGEKRPGLGKRGDGSGAHIPYTGSSDLAKARRSRSEEMWAYPLRLHV
jgi:hypothetical protein